MGDEKDGVSLLEKGGKKVGFANGVRKLPELSDYKNTVGIVIFIIVVVGLLQGLVLGIVLSICAGAFAVSGWLIRWMLLQDEGDENMQQIYSAIREGSSSFFRRVYGTIFKLSIPMSLIIFAIYSMRAPPKSISENGEVVVKTSHSGFGVAFLTSFSFLLGAGCSAMAGYIGLWTSTHANVRVAAAATKSYTQTVQVCLRSGAIAALIVVTLVVLGVALLFVLFEEIYVGTSNDGDITFAEIPLLLIGYGFGASFVALFAQLGGGIFTKAADVGADLVGKVEQDIPEDDPRNPAVIADLVGDNVGDCSARGADLFESIAAEIISAMILGGTLSSECKMPLTEVKGYVLFPLIIHAFDIVVSTVGVLSVGAKPGAEDNVQEDPLIILKRGYAKALMLAFLGFGIATRWLLYTSTAPDAWKHFYACGVVGMVSGYVQVLITQYYTDYIYRPVQSIAKASQSGHATNVIAGLAVGLESTMLPVLAISTALLSSYWLGKTSGLQDSDGLPNGGLFGTAVATMGMLSTAAYILAMDVFGPIADNAGGIVEMSGQPEHVRDITDRLDAVGNTTKAATKGYAIGSAALACFLLFRAFMDEVYSITGIKFNTVDIAVPEVFVGGLLGASLVYLFSAFAMSAVGESAESVVTEVRRQFREIPGIMTGETKPEYGICVDVVSQAALAKMIKPGLLAVGMPIFTGLFFRLAGQYTGDDLLGARALAGFMMFATVSGILMALFMNNAGGAWDNTKKLVETGKYGGKGSETHKASVTGDTVGDPSKDTVGPSIHVLIKLLATVTLVLCPLFVNSSG